MAIFATLKDVTFQVGDIVRLHMQAQEARRRQSIVEGQVLGIRGEGANKSFILRRIGTGGVGVEYIFPLMSPHILSVEVKQKSGSGVRHAKLYFLRGQPGIAFDRITRRVSKKGRVGAAQAARSKKRPKRKVRKARA